MFSLRYKKNIDTFWLKKASYQELCMIPLEGGILHMTLWPFIAQSLSLSHFPSSKYDVNNVEKDVKHQIIIIIIIDTYRKFSVVRMCTNTD